MVLVKFRFGADLPPSTARAGFGKVRVIVKAKPFLHCHHRFKNGKDHCYWSIAEKVRTHRGWVQRPLLYLGEINDSQKAAWTKVTEVFDPVRPADPPVGVVSGGSGGARSRHAIMACKFGWASLSCGVRGNGARAGWAAGCGINCSWMSFGASGCPIRGKEPAGGRCWRP